MFTGIVRTIGRVRDINDTGGEGRGMRVSFDPDELGYVPENGASVAVDGVCLTVTETGEDWFGVDVSEETLDRTTLSRIGQGDRVNLEPSLRAGDELGGHFVFGHVDAVASITAVERREEYRDLTVDIPEHLRHLVAEKGSVALDGISLTVNEVNGGRVSIRIVPHTLEQTTLDEREAGDSVNLEVDMLARYVSRMLGSTEDGSLTLEDLERSGFLDGGESFPE